MNTTSNISNPDLDILRRLAGKKAHIVGTAVNEERRKSWYALDSGQDARPMVLAEHGGVRDKNAPFLESSLECADEWARGVEGSLHNEIYRFETLRDDYVIEPFYNVNWKIDVSNYGVEREVFRSDDETHMGAVRWDPPIVDLDADFAMLKPRTFSVDRDATLKEKARLETVFDGILDVRIRGAFYWTMGLTIRAIDLIGLENLMLYMYDNPVGLHRLMAFLRDDHIAFSDWLEREGLYTLNNENDYIGSGSMGYTHELGKSGAPPVGRDLWVLVESQETVGVGPDQFEEFVFPYQSAIAEKFGKTYYGCCEPVHTRWHVIKRIPNLARVSVSPWADQPFMAEALGRDYVFSRKPNPSLISTGHFDEDAIGEDIRNTLDAAGGCRVEIIMKDVHTLHEEPERLPRWVSIAREEIEKHT